MFFSRGTFHPKTKVLNMLKDQKLLIYGGGLFAGAAIVMANLPSDAAPCDARTMCAPLPIHMGDLPSEDAPEGPGPGSLLTVNTTASISVSSLSSVLFRIG